MQDVSRDVHTQFAVRKIHKQRIRRDDVRFRYDGNSDDYPEYVRELAQIQ